MPSHEFVNRLLKEPSPFLKRHSYDPVDWFPWGEEVITTAKEQNKLIFLAIGYEASSLSMKVQREVFSDIEAAHALNQAFICTLMDKDQWPCTSDLYYEFAHAFFLDNLRWPLFFALSPSLHPIFVAKDLPLESNDEEVGVIDFVQKVEKIWNENRDIVNRETAVLIDELTQKVLSKGHELPRKSFLIQFKECLFPHVDALHGGENGLPKFLNASHLKLLMSWLADDHDDRSILYITRTLDRAFYGSLRDHVNGGFFRSCKNKAWKEPFLEKRLGENAYIAEIYLHAWKIFKVDRYKQIVEEILDHILDDYLIEEGVYQCYEADLLRDGSFYAWSYKDLEEIIGKERAKLIGPYLSIHNDKKEHAPFVEVDLDYYCSNLHLDPDIFLEELELALGVLRQARLDQGKPDKFKSWILKDNAFLAASLLQAGLAFNSTKYLKEGLKVLDKLLKSFWDDEKLSHMIADNQLSEEIIFTDYAVIIYALIHAYELGFGEEYLQKAVLITEKASIQFKKEGGAFYSSDKESKHLFYKQCELPDDVLPSGNALHAENLQRLHLITGEEKYLEACEDILKTVQPLMEVYPLGYSHHFYVLWKLKTNKITQLNLQQCRDKMELKKVQLEVSKKFMPYVTVCWHNSPSMQTPSVVNINSKRVQTFSMGDLGSIIKGI